LEQYQPQRTVQLVPPQAPSPVAQPPQRAASGVPVEVMPQGGAMEALILRGVDEGCKHAAAVGRRLGGNGPPPCTLSQLGQELRALNRCGVSLLLFGKLLCSVSYLSQACREHSQQDGCLACVHRTGKHNGS
jgi:hypothetical protein